MERHPTWQPPPLDRLSYAAALNPPRLSPPLSCLVSHFKKHGSYLGVGVGAGGSGDGDAQPFGGLCVGSDQPPQLLPIRQ